MRGFVRVVACLAIALFVAGLVKQRPWDRRAARQAALAGRSPNAMESRAGGGVEAMPDVESTPDRQVADVAQRDPAAPPRSAGAGPLEADTAAPSSYRTPMVKALGGVIEQHSDVFGGADDDLRDGLARADAILSDARTSNREALRNANRQVRLPGRSPHLLIVVVDGLCRDDLSCYGQTAWSTPASDRVAREGVRSTGFTLDAAGTDANLFSWLSGDRYPDRPAQEPPGARLRFSEMLWQSGYAPGLLGSRYASGWRADQPGGWELCFGWNDASASHSGDWSPFPAQVSSGVKTLRVAGSRDSVSVAFSQVLRDEAVSFARSQRARRPVALVVSTPLAWWQVLASSSAAPSAPEQAEASATESHRAAAIARFDEFLGRLVAGLASEVGKDHLLVMLAGVSHDASEVKRDSSSEASTGGAPLLVCWPGHLPAGAVVETKCGATDILPTIADAIQSTRKPRPGPGRSQWTTWRNTQVAHLPHSGALVPAAAASVLAK